MQKFCCVIGFGLAFLVACNAAKETPKEVSGPGGSGTPAPDVVTQPGVGQLTLSSNALAAAYPEGMALAAFPKAVDESPGQAPVGTLILSAGLVEGTDAAAMHPKVAMQESRDRLEAKEGVECLTREMLEAMRSRDEYIDACFGFDTGIVDGTVMGALRNGQNEIVASVSADPNARTTEAVRTAFGNAIANPSSGPWDVRADVSNEVCMVATGRHHIRQETAAVEGLLKLMQGTLCQAKRDGLDELPADVNGTLDLSTSLKRAPTSAGDTYVWKSAVITRLPDREGRKVYKTAMAYETRSGDGSTVRNHDVTFVHSPGEKGNSTYNGVIYLRVADNRNSVPDATSFLYSRTGETYDTARMQYEMRHAMLGAADPFGPDGRVDFNAGANPDHTFSMPTGTATYIAFDVNPFTFAGKISFWNNPGPANYLEAARGFVYSTEQDVSGKLKGCAVAGAVREGTIRKTLAEGKAPSPTGCFTPQIGNGDCASFAGHPDNASSAVWKQCFAQNDVGLYVLDAGALEANARGYKVFQNSVMALVPEVNLLGMPTLGAVK